MRSRSLAFLLALLPASLAATLVGCGLAPSNVVAKKDRAVVDRPEDVRWGPARKEDVLGSFESDSVTGEAAASVRRVEYVFDADGTYSGAALVQEAKRATFQTLSGRWRFENGTLRLGDDPPARTEAAPGRLRLTTEGGTVTFHRPGA